MYYTVCRFCNVQRVCLESPRKIVIENSWKNDAVDSRQGSAMAQDGSGATGQKMITDTDITSFIDELTQMDVNVYPNPSNGSCIMTINSNEGVLDIISTTGKTVFTKEITTTKTNINLSSELSGLFILRLTSNGTVYTQKLHVIK